MTMNIYAIARVRVPNATLKVLLRMAKTLLRDVPDQANEAMKKAAGKLADLVARIEAALEARMRAGNPHLAAREIEFDRAVDSLWIFLRDVLELCAQAFGHPGLEQLSPARQAAIDLPQLRVLAGRAASLLEQLFAAEGSAFMRASLTVQVESMATILRLIEHDELEQDLQSIVGASLLEALRVCQAQYEEMVDDRMRRERGFAEDFRELRAQLRWLVDRYKIATETLHDEEAPETLALVEQALRPLLSLSEAMALGNPRRVEEAEAELVEAPDYEAFEDAVAEAEAAEQGEQGEPPMLEVEPAQ